MRAALLLSIGLLSASATAAGACDLDGLIHGQTGAYTADELSQMGYFAESAKVRAQEQARAAAMEAAKVTFMKRFRIEADAPASESAQAPALVLAAAEPAPSLR